MQKVPLKVIIDLLYQNERDLSIEINNETLFDSSAVYNEFYRYSDFYVLFFTPYAGTADFMQMWNDFLSVNGENLYRKFHALYADYNPINNYDMTEESFDGHKIGKDKSTTTPHGKITNETTQSGTDKTTETLKRYGLDSVSGNDADVTTVEYQPTNRKETTETTYGQNTNSETESEPENLMSDTFDGQTVSGYHDITSHKLKRSGNIGTTTNMQMITAELQGRNNALLYSFINMFIMHHCIVGCY